MNATGCTKSTLLTNARIYRTAFDDRPATALLIRGGSIAWVGNSSDAPYADTICDLRGAVALPGLTDSHVHLFAVAQNKLQLSLSSVQEKSISDVLARLSAYSAAQPDTEWVAAAELNEDRLHERRMPTRVELDSAVPHRPVLVRRYCGHAAIVNSVALRRLGINDNVSDPPGGVFGRTSDGLLNGIAHEKAAEAIFASARTVKDDDLIGAIRSVIGECNRYGIVAAVEAAVGFTSGFDEEERIWHIMTENEQLPIRLGFMLALDPEQARQRGLNPALNPDVQRATLKFFADGIIGGRTAAVSEPYCDVCSRGFFVRPEADLKRVVIQAHRDDWQVAVHAIGDRAISCIISAFEEAHLQAPKLHLRHRIEHYFCPPPGGYARMKALGAMIVTQPGFLKRMGGSIRAALGQRADRCYPARSVLEAGVQLVASSDAPTGLLSPWEGMAAAIDRGESGGNVIGRDDALTSREALAAYTSAGAFAMMQEGWRGSLHAGMAADLVIVDRDPIGATAGNISRLKPLATMVRGAFVFGSPAEFRPGKQLGW